MTERFLSILRRDKNLKHFVNEIKLTLGSDVDIYDVNINKHKVP